MVRGTEKKGGVLVVSRSANANQNADEEGGNESRRGGASTRGSGASMMTNKVVFRHLPPTLTAEDFLAIVTPLPEHRYFQWCKADYSAGVDAAFCRAYVGLRRLDDVYSVCSRWDGYEFSDTKGFMYPALVEFSPNQRIPDRIADGSYQFLAPDPPDAVEKSLVPPPDVSLAKKPKKQNTLKGTLIDDDDFKVFCDKLTSSRSAFVSGSNDQAQQVISPETMLKEIEDRHRADEDGSKKKSPLVEFLEQRRRGIDANRRILSKSGQSSAGVGGDRRGGGQASSGGQQKKRRRDRRRERGGGAKNAAAPVVGTVKIASKPPSAPKNNNDEPGEAPSQPPAAAKDRRVSAEEEGQHQNQSRSNRPGSYEQRKNQQQRSSARESNEADRDYYHQKQQGRQQSQPSASKQQSESRKQSDRNRDDSAQQQQRSPVVATPTQMRFVDTGDDDAAGDERGNRQQRSAYSASKQSSSSGRGVSSAQQDNRRHSADKQPQASSRGNVRQKTYDQQRDYHSPRGGRQDEDDFEGGNYNVNNNNNYEDEERRAGSSANKGSSGGAASTSSSSRPTSGHSVGRTMVFSRSLAAAVSSGASSGRPARFDPRRGNAPPPSGASGNN